MEMPDDLTFCGECGNELNSPEPEKSVCKSCGFELPNGMMFCGQCGTDCSEPIAESIAAVPVEPAPQPIHRICQGCNSELPDNMVFCGQCGAAYGASAQPAPPQPVYQQQHQPQQTAYHQPASVSLPKSKKKLLIAIIGGIGALGVIGVIIAIAVNSGGGGGYTPSSNNRATCFATPCSSSPVSGGSYCSFHTCDESGCTTNKRSVIDERHRGSYCLAHTCAEADCFQRRGTGGYCTTHVQ